LRVLKPGGKIVVLTPTGCGSIWQQLRLLSRMKFSIKNGTFFVWKNATRFNGRQWVENNILKEVAKENKWDYSRQTVFEGFALIETLRKKSL